MQVIFARNAKNVCLYGDPITMPYGTGGRAREAISMQAICDCDGTRRSLASLFLVFVVMLLLPPRALFFCALAACVTSSHRRFTLRTLYSMCRVSSCVGRARTFRHAVSHNLYAKKIDFFVSKSVNRIDRIKKTNGGIFRLKILIFFCKFVFLRVRLSNSIRNLHRSKNYCFFLFPARWRKSLEKYYSFGYKLQIVFHLKITAARAFCMRLAWLVVRKESGKQVELT